MNRVVITGMGWVTPMGHSIEGVWKRLLNGESGIARTSLFDASMFPTSISAEVKNHIADPDDLIAMYRTDFANLFRMPVIGGIKLNHELNSVFATTTKIIELNDYVLKGEQGVQGLIALLNGTINELRERLRPYKK